MRRSEQVMRQPLQALLLSSALVGWGILRGWWWLGLLLTVCVELPRLVRGRKGFRAADFSRAFTLSWVILGTVGVILWVQDVEREQYKVLVELLPVFFLPVMLTQLFAQTRDFPLHVVSIISSWRYKSDLKEGREPKEWRMNFGYLYLMLILVASSWSLPTLNMKCGYALMVALIFWRLTFWQVSQTSPRQRWRGQITYLFVLIAAGGIGLGSIWLYRLLDSGKWVNYLNSIEMPAETSTALGKLGEIKKDPKIHWRIIDPQFPVPPLWRDRVFNVYLSKTWRHIPVDSEIPRKEDYHDFREIVWGDAIAQVPAPPSHANLDPKPADFVSTFRLRGKGAQQTLLPTTKTSILFETSSLDVIENNSLGTIIGTNPTTGVLDYLIHSERYDRPHVVEEPPAPEIDLEIPEPLYEALDSYLAEADLSSSDSLVTMQRTIKRKMNSDFTYTTNGQISGPDPIKTFLRDQKVGHCEYFATSGVMLLRRLGIPARYAIGYSAKEYDPKRNEWVMRGLHAHAWVRAWNQEEGRWIDLDFTPPDEGAFGSDKAGVLQGMADGVKRWREDFIVWRAENPESWVFTVLPWFLVVLLVLIFGRNLVKVRSVKAVNPSVDRALRPLIRKLKLAPRRESETYQEWLAETGLSQRDRAALVRAIEQNLYGLEQGQSSLKHEVQRCVASL